MFELNKQAHQRLLAHPLPVLPIKSTFSGRNLPHFRRGQLLLYKPADCLRQHLLLIAESQIHFLDPLSNSIFCLRSKGQLFVLSPQACGKPSTRSATILRCTSLVPASMVLPRARRYSYCQRPSKGASTESGARLEKGPSSSKASSTRRWFNSLQCNLSSEPSGPGRWPWPMVDTWRMVFSLKVLTSV